MEAIAVLTKFITAPYPEPVESNLHLPTLRFNVTPTPIYANDCQDVSQHQIFRIQFFMHL